MFMFGVHRDPAGILQRYAWVRSTVESFGLFQDLVGHLSPPSDLSRAFYAPA